MSCRNLCAQPNNPIKDLEWKVKLAVSDLLTAAHGAARLQLNHAVLGKINIVIGDDEFLLSQASGAEQLRL
jgi:hypothetical protein